MVAAGYIASQVVLSIACATLLALSIVLFYSGRWVHHRTTGRAIKVMHIACVAAALLNAVRMVDPDSVLGVYDSAVNQWLSTNCSAVILCAAIFFLLNLIESVAHFYGGLHSGYLLAVYVLMVVELLGAELSVGVAMAEHKWWPTAIFLFINGPLALILLAGMTYAAHTTRRAVHDSMAEHGGLRDSDEEAEEAEAAAAKKSKRRSTGGGGGGDAKKNGAGGAGPDGRSAAVQSASQRFKAALNKLLYVQIGASALLVLTAVFCLYFAATRVGDKKTAMADALRKDPLKYTAASVDWALLLQTLAIGAGVGYSWVPMPWVRPPKSAAEAAEENQVFADYEREQRESQDIDA